MKRLLVLIALFAVIGPKDALAAPAHHPALAQRSDPCGFRYAMWPVVQQSADYITAVAGGQISDTYTSGMRDNYLDEELAGITLQYGSPKGSQALSTAMSNIVGALDDAVQSGSYDSSFNFYINAARKAQTHAWKVVSHICSWRGKSFTWTGYLNVYGSGITTTPVFHVPHAWALNWDFDCGNSNGNFIAIIETPSGGWVKQAANRLSTGDGDLTFMNRGGWYKIDINSECAWHVQAVNQ